MYHFPAGRNAISSVLIISRYCTTRNTTIIYEQPPKFQHEKRKQEELAWQPSNKATITCHLILYNSMCTACFSYSSTKSRSFMGQPSMVDRTYLSEILPLLLEMIAILEVFYSHTYPYTFIHSPKPKTGSKFSFKTIELFMNTHRSLRVRRAVYQVGVIRPTGTRRTTPHTCSCGPGYKPSHLPNCALTTESVECTLTSPMSNVVIAVVSRRSRQSVPVLTVIALMEGNRGRWRWR